jgi:hypothetical protein
MSTLWLRIGERSGDELWDAIARPHHDEMVTADDREFSAA